MSKMSSWELLEHYWSDEGTTKTLEDIGVQQEYESLVKMPNALGKQGGHSLHGDFLQQILNGRTHFRNGYSVNTPLYRWNEPTWAIGSAHIEGQFYGDVITQNGNYFLVGQIVYSLYDRFTDPYDTPNIIPGEWNPNGEPFEITGSWIEPVNITITQEQYEQFKAKKVP